jgi:hypothetical protein
LGNAAPARVAGKRRETLKTLKPIYFVQCFNRDEVDWIYIHADSLADVITSFDANRLRHPA